MAEQAFGAGPRIRGFGLNGEAHGLPFVLTGLPESIVVRLFEIHESAAGTGRTS